MTEKTGIKEYNQLIYHLNLQELIQERGGKLLSDYMGHYVKVKIQCEKGR